MRVCLMIEGQEGVSWEQWLALAETAERAGLEGLFRSDHYLSIMRGREAGALDAWTTLAAIAARTERIRLGTMVSPVTFRHPAVLARSAVTVDHVSRGRVELGMGAGWMEAEHEAHGFPFPPMRERVAELARQMGVVVSHWTDAEGAWPKPVQRPHPPLIVGGAAKRGTVEPAVRLATEYDTTGVDPTTAGERRRVLDEACERAGRDPATLIFSVMTSCVVAEDESMLRKRIARFTELTGHEPGPRTVAGTLEQAAERLREYEDAGVSRFYLQHLVHEDVAMVEELGALARMVG